MVATRAQPNQTHSVRADRRPGLRIGFQKTHEARQPATRAWGAPDQARYREIGTCCRLADRLVYQCRARKSGEVTNHQQSVGQRVDVSVGTDTVEAALIRKQKQDVESWHAVG